MYLSICKKNFKDFKVGDLFDTCYKKEYTFIRPKGTKLAFISLPYQEYKTYFIEFKEYMFLPVLDTVYKGVFRKKEIKERNTEYFNFKNMVFEDLLAMQLPIIEKIGMLSKINGFASHTDSLFKSLKELESIINDPFYPFYEDSRVKQKINYIASLVSEAEKILTL